MRSPFWLPKARGLELWPPGSSLKRLVLPLSSKVYEILNYNQLSQYTEIFLSQILCGFKKAHTTQHALFKLPQSLQNELNNGGFIGMILIDLSKAYDSTPYELLIAELQ